MALPLSRFFNLVYYFATENADEAEKDKFDMKLNMPDARSRRRARRTGQDPAGIWSKKAEENALAAFVSDLTAGS